MIVAVLASLKLLIGNCMATYGTEWQCMAPAGWPVARLRFFGAQSRKCKFRIFIGVQSNVCDTIFPREWLCSISTIFMTLIMLALSLLYNNTLLLLKRFWSNIKNRADTILQCFCQRSTQMLKNQNNLQTSWLQAVTKQFQSVAKLRKGCC